MDEVFGDENFVVADYRSERPVGTGSSWLAGRLRLSFFGMQRTSSTLKYRQLLSTQSAGRGRAMPNTILSNSTDGHARRMTRDEKDAIRATCQTEPQSSADRQSHKPASAARDSTFTFRRQDVSVRQRGDWKTTSDGMTRLAKADRACSSSATRFVTCAIFDDFPCQPIDNICGRYRTGRLRRRKVYVVQTVDKGHRALHPHGHRPRRPRARPDLRFRHHRLRRRAMGPPLDHHRHLARGAGAGPCPHHGRALSVLPAGRFPRRPAQGSRSHRHRAILAAGARQHPPRLRLRARAAHHAQIHRQQRRDRCHLGQVAGEAGAAAREAERGAQEDLAGMGDSARSRCQVAGRGEEAARRLVAGPHRPAEGDRRLHRRQGRVRIPLRQALRGQEEGPRGRAVHRREPLAPPHAGRRRERRADRSARAKRRNGDEAELSPR